MTHLLIKIVTSKARITVLSPLFKIMQTNSGFTFPNTDSNSFKFIFIIVGGWLSWLGHWQCCGPVSFSVCFHIFQLLAVACLSANKQFCCLPFSYQTILLKRENARVLALEQISSNEHKVDLESHQGFLLKKIVFDGDALFEIFSMTNFSCKKCETEIGSVERQKEEELGTLTRLLEGLKLDKDILTQLKVRKYVSQ